MNNSELENIVLKHKELGQSVCKTLMTEIVKLGFDYADIKQKPDYSTAIFELIHDPFTGQQNLQANWVNEHKHLIGQLQFQSNGCIYAEFDVIKNHPVKTNWFVEAITAWGRAEAIKTEARLLPLP